MDGTVDLDAFARARYGLFRLSDALEAGWTPRMLRRKIEQGRVERVHETVYRFRGAPDTWSSRALAMAWTGGAQCGLSHRSAAKVYAFPSAADVPIHIICPRWDRSQHAGVHVHEFSGLLEADLTEVARLPVVVPELAVLQIAGYRWSDVDHVEAAIYSARRQGWLTNASLQEYLYRRARRGRPGVRKLRLALERSWQHARPTDSDMETLMLHALRRHGFPEPTLQFELRDAKGTVIATTDAALETWHILLEYDSKEFHSDPKADARDFRRRAWAAEYGYWLIPVRYDDLKDGGAQLARAIRGALRTMGIAQSREPA